MKHKIIISGILLVVAIIFFCLNLFVPYYDDDVWYSLKYIPDAIVAPITQFSDILASQYYHYIGENSRAIIHITLQSLLAILPDWGFDLVNTAMFLLLVYTVTCYTLPSSNKVQPLAILLTVIGIYALLPDMDYLFYWAAGSLNYLWSSVATILFLLLWRKCIADNSKVTLSTWLAAIVAWGCAFSHEAFALPVCAGVLVYMIAHYRHIGYNTTTVVALAYGLGGVAILLAPGMENKTEHIGYESAQHYINQLIITIRNLRALPLCIMIAVVSCCRKSWRKQLATFIREQRYLLFITFMAFLMVATVRAGAQNLRIFYASEFFALLLLLRYTNILLLNNISTRLNRVLLITTSALIVFWSIIVLPASYRAGSQHYDLFEQYPDDEDGVLFLTQEKTPCMAQRWVMNMHKYYYDTPEAEWRAFVIPLAHLGDTLSVPSPLLVRDENLAYRLYNRYIQILPHSIEPAITTPELFFTPRYKVVGNNPFYITADSCYIIAPTDSLAWGTQWQWHYHRATWREPSASPSGFIKRLIAPHTFPLTAPVEYPDTITLPDSRSYVIYARPAYRTLKSIEPLWGEQYGK